MNNFNNKSIILFDGVCNLCNNAVNYIIKHDKKKYFLFASLQSDAAKEILLQFNLKKNNLNTIILIQNQKIYIKSTAVLHIAKQLNGVIKLVTIFFIIPKFLRDFIYHIVAKNRYKWFGRRNSCMIPSEKLKNRFIG